MTGTTAPNAGELAAVAAALSALSVAVHLALSAYALTLLWRLRRILREPKARMLTAFAAIGLWHACIDGAALVTGDGAPLTTAAGLLTGAVLLLLVRRTAISSRSWVPDPVPDPVL